MKVAVLMTSYKRLSELSRQIFSFRSQTYTDFHLFAAVKGFSEHTFETRIRPQFSRLEEEGFLTLRYFPNKNQLSNLLDTVRDLDITAYDLFLKIDDDDFYDIHYVEDTVRFHSQEEDTKSSMYQPDNAGHTFSMKDGMPIFRQGYNWSSPTLALRQHILEILFDIESCPGADLVSKYTNGKEQRLNFGFNEDDLIHKILLAREERLNRFEFVYAAGRLEHFTGNKTGESTTRQKGHYLNQAFRDKNRDLSSNKNLWEEILTLNYKQWHEDIYSFNRQVLNSQTSQQGKITEQDNNSLTIQWEDDRQESFVKTNRKTYDFVSPGQFDMLVVSLPGNQKKRESISRQFHEQNLSFAFIDGVTIDNYDDIRESERNCLEAYRTDRLKTNPLYVNRAIGCKRAMIKAIKKAAEYKNWVIIFQDDIHLTENFNGKLNKIMTQVIADTPDCGIVLLHKAGKDLKVGKFYKHIISDVRSMAAFAVHPDFAPKLAEKLENWGGEADRIWGELVKINSRLLYCSDIGENLVWNNQKDSDIISGIAELEVFWK